MPTTITVKDANAASVTVPVLPSLGLATAAGSLPVVLASDTVSSLTVSGTVAVSNLSAFPTAFAISQATPGSTNKVSIGSDGIISLAGNAPVAGDLAVGTTDVSNPVKIGGVARTALPAAVADGQRVAALLTKHGKQVVVDALRETLGLQYTSITTVTETAITPATASTFCDLYSILINNSGSASVNVTIRNLASNVSGTTVTHVITVPAGDARGFTIPASSAIAQTTANNTWTATASASGTLGITALFVKNS